MLKYERIEYEGDIIRDKQIDPDILDVEWLEQSNLFYKYSSALSDAMQERNQAKLESEQAKESLEKVKAELLLQIRKNPDFYGLDKVTDTTVDACIKLQEEYQEALENLNQAKKRLNEKQNFVNQLYSCTQTMEQRKASLEALSSLFKMQYFSTPNEPQDLSKKYKNFKETQKNSREKIKERKKRRSK